MGKNKPSWIGVKEVRDSKTDEVKLKSKVFAPGTWSRDKYEEKCPPDCEKHAQCYTQVIIKLNLDKNHRIFRVKRGLVSGAITQKNFIRLRKPKSLLN